MKKKLRIMGIAATVAFFTSFGIGYAASPCTFMVVDGESIQDIIDIANPGDKICVEPGTYTEDLTITTDGIALAGRTDKITGEQATIEGIATNPGPSFPLAAPNIDIRANGVSIHGFTIKSPVVTASQYSSGIVLTGENITIFNNNFLVGTGEISQGIQTWNTVANPEVIPGNISGLKIFNNWFSHLTSATGYLGYEGIYINPQGAAVTPSNPVVIENNQFSGNLIRAITTERSYTNIRNNRMTTDSVSLFGAFPTGIQLGGSGSQVLVLGNKVDDDGTSVFVRGIVVGGGVTLNIIKKNEVNAADLYGIIVYGSANQMIQNRVRNSGTDLTDDNLGCDNDWIHNIFGTSNQDCIH